MQGQKEDEDSLPVVHIQLINGIIVNERESPLASRLAPSCNFAARALLHDVALGGEADLSHARVELGGAGGEEQQRSGVCASACAGVWCCMAALTTPAAA